MITCQGLLWTSSSGELLQCLLLWRQGKWSPWLGFQSWWTAWAEAVVSQDFWASGCEFSWRLSPGQPCRTRLGEGSSEHCPVPGLATHHVKVWGHSSSLIQIRSYEHSSGTQWCIGVEMWPQLCLSSTGQLMQRCRDLDLSLQFTPWRKLSPRMESWAGVLWKCVCASLYLELIWEFKHFALKRTAEHYSAPEPQEDATLSWEIPCLGKRWALQ